MSKRERTFYHQRKRKKLKMEQTQETLSVDTVEFDIVCDGKAYNFTIVTADDTDPIKLQELAIIGITATDEEFISFHMLFVDDEQLAIIKDVFIKQILDIRNSLPSENCFVPQEDVLEVSENEIKEQPTINQPEPEITMTNPAQVYPDNNTNDSINQTENQTMNQESAMNQAAQDLKNAAEELASKAADAAKTAADATKVTVEKAAEATQGFASRHKKKLIIGGALAAGVTIGFFGWKYRMNIPFLGKAAEAATEATTA